MCINKNVVIGLAVAAGAVVLIAPGSALALLPLLLIAACPLSMLVMMRAMSGSGSKNDPVAPATDSAATAEVAQLRAQVAELEARQSPLIDRD